MLNLKSEIDDSSCEIVVLPAELAEKGKDAASIKLKTGKGKMIFTTDSTPRR